MENLVPRVSPVSSRWGLLVTQSDIGEQTLKRQDCTFSLAPKACPWPWEGRWVEGIYKWASKHPVNVAPLTSLPPQQPPTHNSYSLSRAPYPTPEATIRWREMDVGRQMTQFPSPLLGYLGCNPHNPPRSLALLHLSVPGSL